MALTTVKLSDITEKTPLVKDFAARLKRTSKQAIARIEIQRVKRVSGASARPVIMHLENGQTVSIYLRLIVDSVNGDHFDIFRIDINGKSQPLSGDFDNSYKPSFNASVDMIANTVVNGQTAFTKKLAQASRRVKPPSVAGRAPQNKSQQRNTLIQEANELDNVIATKQNLRDELAAQLEALLNPPPVVAAE